MDVQDARSTGAHSSATERNDWNPLQGSATTYANSASELRRTSDNEGVGSEGPHWRRTD